MNWQEYPWMSGKFMSQTAAPPRPWPCGWIALVCLWLLPCGAFSAAVEDLYEYEVAVPDQSVEARNAGIQQALTQVLIKVSGKTDAALEASIQPKLKEAVRYVQQYRYRQLAPSAQTGSTGEMRLWVKFDAAAIGELLGEADLPVWEQQARPDLLVWLALEEDGQRRLLGADMEAGLPPLLTKHAQRRGLNVVLPLLDLEDRERLSVSDVWGEFHEAIWAASERYHSDGVLVGRLSRLSGGQWTGYWTLLQEAAVETWEVHNQTLNQVLASGIDNAADLLANRFVGGAQTAQENTFMLIVEEVTSLRDYAHVMQFLQSLSAVRRVALSEVTPSRLRVQLGAQTDREGLIRAMSLGRLIPIDGVENEALVYRWQ
jgi:hypothetical protein